MGVSVLLRTCFINRAIAEELIWFLVCCCVLEAEGHSVKVKGSLSPGRCRVYYRS